MNESTTLNDFKYQTQIPIRFSDMDLFGHANNAIFLTYFEQARSKYWEEIIGWNWNEMGIILAKAEVEFISPVLINDQLFAYVRTSRIGNSSFDIDYLLVSRTETGENIRAKGKTVQVSFDYKTNKPALIPVIYKSKMIDFDNL